jgi:uncharacterized HAD superfamily protein
MSNAIIIQQMSIEDLQNLLDSSISNSLKKLIEEKYKKDISEELMSREETCQFLKIDSSTLWHWTNKGKIKAYGIGSRRYYKRSDLLECLTLLNKK